MIKTGDGLTIDPFSSPRFHITPVTSIETSTHGHSDAQALCSTTYL